MLFSEADHPLNPPETWRVVKAAPKRWDLITKDGVILECCSTKKAAEALIHDGFHVTLYEKERRWYAGESVANWRPWAEVKAEQIRTQEWLDSRNERV